MKNTNNTKTEKLNTTKNANKKVNNIEKTNLKYNDLFISLLSATNKKQCVDAYNNHGFSIATAPTLTPNKTDVYMQFNKVNCGDLSRLRVRKNCIDIFVTEKVATAIENEFKNEKVVCVDKNDGGGRIKTAVFDTTLENYTRILNTFIDCGVTTQKPYAVIQ